MLICSLKSGEGKRFSQCFLKMAKKLKSIFCIFDHSTISIVCVVFSMQTKTLSVHFYGI